MPHIPPYSLKKIALGSVIAALIGLPSINAFAKDKKSYPAQKFDLSQWNITLPIDVNKDKKPDTVTVKRLRKYSHPDFFYLDAQDRLVFASPNKAATTKNSSNTRSELRQMIRGTNTRIKTHSVGNNFSIAAHDFSDKLSPHARVIQKPKLRILVLSGKSTR